MDNSLQVKLDKLKEIVSGYSKVAIAFSSGVDSTLLVKIATDLHGENSIAFFCNSALQPSSVLAEVHDLINHIGAELIVVESDIFSDNSICQNSAERCYLCKKKTYTLFFEQASKHGCTVLMDGTNLDDDDSVRPGSLAIKELGVRTPLRDAGFSKKDIRKLSKEFNLPTWNKHSASCLATRVQTGEEITSDKLFLISQVEEILINHNFYGCRVRLCSNKAIIQLIAEDQIRFIAMDIHKELKKILKIEGFRQVFLDLSGREGILL